MKALAWRALRRFYDHQMTQHAAALTYYAMLSLFPGLLIAVALLGTFGQEDSPADVVRYLERHGAPESVTQPVEALLRGVVRAGTGTAGLTLGISLVIALIGASGWFASARRAINAALDVPEERSFVRRKLADFGATLLLIGIGLLILITLFLAGGAADDLFDEIGIGAQVADVWHVARWPAALALTFAAYAFVYSHAPDVPPERWHTFSPGALIAVPLWLVVSWGFFFYVSHLGQLAGYGTLASAIVLLIWLFLSHAALLLGAVINAEVTAADRAAAAASPPGDADTASPAPGTSRTDPRTAGP